MLLNISLLLLRTCILALRNILDMNLHNITMISKNFIRSNDPIHDITITDKA